MRRSVLLLVVALVTANAQAAGRLAMEKVSESVYVVRPLEADTRPGHAVSNAAFVVLPDRVLLYDTLSSRDLMVEMMQLITSVTTLPVNTLVFSHWHPDHTGGLEYFLARRPRIYAAPGMAEAYQEYLAKHLAYLERQLRDLSTRIRSESDAEQVATLQKRHQDMWLRRRTLSGLPRLRADEEVATYLQINPGGVPVLLNYIGPGHTGSDLIVIVPGDKVMLTGDLLTVTTLPNLADADSKSWIDRLSFLERSNIEKYVPGHGPVGTKSDVKALSNYIEKLRSMIEPIAREGTQDDIMQNLRVPAPFDTWASEDLWFPAAMHVYSEMKRDAASDAASGK